MNEISTKPLISVVIRSKNEENRLPKLISSIKKQKCEFQYEIILVDSGSTDCTIEIAKKNNLRIFEITPELFTYGYALNLGVKFAQGEIVIFISAHTYIITKFWLKNLVLPFFNDSDIKCTYGKLISNKAKNPFEWVIFSNMYSSTENELLFGIFQYEKLANSNSNAAYRKEFLLKNKFDIKIPFQEDRLMGLKILRDNFKLMYISNAMIYHTHPYKFHSNFIKSVKIGYSLEYIDYFFFNRKINVFLIFYKSFKIFFLDFLYFFRNFIIMKDYIGILKLLFYLLSRFAGIIIGKIHFFNQHKID